MKQRGGSSAAERAVSCREVASDESRSPLQTIPMRLMAVEHASGAWWEILDERGRKVGVIACPVDAGPGATEAVARGLVRGWNGRRIEDAGLLLDIAAGRI